MILAYLLIVLLFVLNCKYCRMLIKKKKNDFRLVKWTHNVILTT